MKPSDKLRELNITLPNVAAPIGMYVPALRSGQHVFTSGQLPFIDGSLPHTGKVPGNVSVDQAIECAAQAALNGLAAAAQVAGGVDRIARVVRVCVYVNSSPGFSDQPKVANGASDLLGKIFGDAGKHARSAVGAAELPRNSPVEVELVVELV